LSDDDLSKISMASFRMRSVSNRKQMATIATKKMISIVSLTVCMLPICLAFSRCFTLEHYYPHDKDTSDSCLAYVRQSLETQMATFFYSFLTS
jgi:hypothetical protein